MKAKTQTARKPNGKPIVNTKALAVRPTNPTKRMPRLRLVDRSDIDIEEGIPIPKDAECSGRRLYPFDKLKVGESFSYPALHKHEDNARQLRALSAAINSFVRRERPEWKFVYRKDNSVIRCWRSA